MPIYEYRCERGHTFEVMQRMTEEPLTSCTTCDASVQRVFHPVAVHFKGSGFYSTDYGKKKSSAGAGAGDSSSDTTSSKDEKKTESSSTSSSSDASSSSDGGA
jgi:putative FmdB family regulatory protein